MSPPAPSSGTRRDTGPSPRNPVDLRSPTADPPSRPMHTWDLACEDNSRPDATNAMPRSSSPEPLATDMPDLTEIRTTLEQVGQDHLLRFHDELDSAGRRRLLERIEAIEPHRLPALVDRYVKSKPGFEPPADLAPAPYYPRDPKSSRRAWPRDEFEREGERLLRRGAVAVFTVAGGQGTRLGYDGPKGCYPGSAATRKPLFRCLAEWIVAAQRRYDAVIPWYIMTSPANHDQTVRYFKDQNWFGLSPEHVSHFQQGVMPSLDRETGRVLLAAKDEPAVNPDGHGGSLRALYNSGALEDMRSRGVEHVSYVQIDNPLVKVIDPVFIGLHAAADDSSAEMSSKMIPKTDPAEKVGVFCLSGGKVSVVEYSDLPEDLAAKRDDRGELRFNAGSPAIHMIGVDFIQRLNEAAGDDGAALTFHRAEKKVPHIDLETGAPIDPDQPNAVKLEMFVFDALPLAEQSIVLETDRVEEFAPIKNAEGNDSSETSRKLQTERAARWLEQAGVKIPRTPAGEPDCTLEISPLTAMKPADLLREDIREKLPERISSGAELAI
ncbi:MAG: UDPGP type 1 family protein [Phycisphaeraceae bacterium]|nr:MAG: UDPGP type 1 family protein [Phycisphaeraceae bacterium]